MTAKPAHGTPGATPLRDVLFAGADYAFDPFTGVPTGESPRRFRAAELGLEAPRYCPLCGRRMVTQILHTGWRSKCSRHGSAESADIDAAREAARDPFADHE